MLVDMVVNARLLRANLLQRLEARRAETAAATTDDDGFESGASGFVETRRKLQRQSASLTLALLRNFVVFPTALHYSFESVGLLSARTQHAVNALAATIKWLRMWRLADDSRPAASPQKADKRRDNNDDDDDDNAGDGALSE